jgi:hypothetical protein
MNNGASQHHLDTIAQLLRHQNAMLEVVIKHLAHTQATLLALSVKSLPEKKLRVAKHMKDQHAILLSIC